MFVQDRHKEERMTHGQQVLDDLRPETRELRKMIPDVYQGFGVSSRWGFLPACLDTKTKREPSRLPSRSALSATDASRRT